MRSVAFSLCLLAACAPTTGKPGDSPRSDTPPDDTAPDDTAPDDTAPDDTAPDDSTPDDTAVNEDADGDGIPDDEDCDRTDVDRGVDCTEGPVVAITGARILNESDDLWPALVGEDELSPEPGLELALTETTDVLAVRSPASGDVVLTDTLLGAVTTDGFPYTDALLGDLDGDGWTDLVQLDIATTQGSDSYDGGLVEYTPSLVAYLGPLSDGPGSAWRTTLDTLTAYGTEPSLVIGDLDADGAPELLFTLGNTETGGGETAAWRLDAAGTATTLYRSDAYTSGENTDVRAVGDVDGDGLVDLSFQSESREAGPWAALHPGPLGDTLPRDDGAAAVIDGPLEEVIPVGDLDGDGLDDVAFRGQWIWVVAGPWSTGALDTLAFARIGPENDDVGESWVDAVGGDVGADGTADLVISDPWWPVGSGEHSKRGALYVFRGMPSGTLDVRAADARVYGAAEGDYFGGNPTVLADGRVAVGGYRDRDATRGVSGAVWLLEGL